MRSSPAVSGGVVYVGSSDRHVYALDAATGELRWRYLTRSFLRSSPAVSGGVVYQGSSDEHVYALDAATGELRWRYQAYDAITSTPAVSGGVVYVGSWDDHVYALDAATGELHWRYRTGGKVYSTPVVSGGVVYVVSSDDYLYALDTATGELRWQYQAYSFSSSSPAVSGGVVYVGSSLAVWAIYHVDALDAATGELLWRYETDGSVRSSSPAVSGGVVYVGSSDDYVYALDAATGELLWRYQAYDAIDSTPAVSGGVVYVGSDDDHVYALDAATGELRWQYRTGGDVSSSPVVSGGVVYVGSYDDHVYALAASTGELPVRSATVAPTPSATPTITTTPTPAPAQSVRIGEREVRPVVQVYQGRGSGTGFAIDDRHVVTNAHVATSLGPVTIQLHDGRMIPGRVVARDGELRFVANYTCIWWEDMALIETDEPMPFVAMLDPAPRIGMSRGDSVQVYGYPRGHAGPRAKSIRNMIVASVGELGIDLKPQEGTQNQVQPGASGSPVIHSGAVVGMVVGTCGLSGGGFSHDPDRIRTIPLHLVIEWVQEVAPELNLPTLPTPIPAPTAVPTSVPIPECDLMRKRHSLSDDLFEDCKVLIQAKPVLEGDGQELNWFASVPMENWQGVTIVDRRVKILQLGGLGLRGRVPVVLAQLELTHFYLDNTSLGTYCIPSELQKVPNNNVRNIGRLWCN